MKAARSPAILRGTVLGLPRRLDLSGPADVQDARQAERSEIGPSSRVDACAGARLEGFEAGRREGLEEGRAQGLAACEQRVSAVRQTAAATLQASLEDERARCREAVVDLGRRFDEWLDALRVAFEEARHVHERQAVDLAFVAVQKILCTPEGRAATLKERLAAVLRSMWPDQPPVVHLAAEDLAELRQEPAFATSLDRVGIVWAADPAAARGSCRVEMGSGEVDLGLATALTQLRSVWLAELGRDPGPMEDAA